MLKVFLYYNYNLKFGFLNSGLDVFGITRNMQTTTINGKLRREKNNLFSNPSEKEMKTIVNVHVFHLM